ncbi:transaldolase [Nocardioides panacihumi]|uniref:Transaldolase n=1 Tax=Nocardioides panacihumi TaxID=400774 RepID=A0ABN2RUJ5_9ACTN
MTLIDLTASTDHSSNIGLGALTASGVSVWLDDLSRRRLRSGDLAGRITDMHVSGVTSNPTILAAAVAEIGDYADQLADLGSRAVPAEEAFRLLTAYDVRAACDLLRPVHEATRGADGWVSVEVDPRLAQQPRATAAEARAWAWLIDRPNLMVKIPATKASLPAIAATIAEGISVNVTLIFGETRYGEVLDAYADGLERARSDGYDLSRIHSVASFFVSRIDTEVDRRLDRLGSTTATALRSQAAIASARLAHRRFTTTIDTERWQGLADAGANEQRLLWASTSVKDPTLPDTRYVTELVAPGVISTMPSTTLEAFADHGHVRGRTLLDGPDEAIAVVDGLAALGIDMEDVARVLEERGVALFATSFASALDTVGRALRQQHA